MTLVPVPLYRLKPVQVVAVQWNGVLGELQHVISYPANLRVNLDKSLTLDTRKGAMRAALGDYVVMDARGETYPVPAELFRDLYEPVTE